MNPARRSHLTVVVLALLIGVLLQACSADTRIGTTSVPDIASPIATPTPTHAEPSDDADTTQPDPRHRIREALFGGASLSEAEFVARRDELIIECMAERGFEYLPTPLPPEELGTYFTTSYEDRREFVEQHGYGISTLYWEQERELALRAATYVDPNEEIRAGMSDAEGEAYDEALLGPAVETIDAGESNSDGVVNEGGEPLVIRNEQDGCKHKAETEIDGIDLAVVDAGVQAALDQIYERVFADEQVLAVDQEWHRCMAEAGYPVEESSLPGYRPTGLELVERMMDELLGTATWITETVTADDGTSVEVEVPEFDEDALARVREQELDISLADVDCDESVGRQETFQAVSTEIQREVIEDHLAELSEALVDTHESE